MSGFGSSVGKVDGSVPVTTGLSPVSLVILVVNVVAPTTFIIVVTTLPGKVFISVVGGGSLGSGFVVGDGGGEDVIGGTDVTVGGFTVVVGPGTVTVTCDNATLINTITNGFRYFKHFLKRM